MARKRLQDATALGRLVGQDAPYADRKTVPLKPYIGKQRFQGFTPYTAPPLPTGTYDPALDAQLQAAHRGLGDTTQDYETAGQRASADYGLQRQGIITAEQHAQQDYQSQRDSLARSYQTLGGRQAQQINAAGTGAGGALLQAQLKRAANQQTDLAPVNTAAGRSADASTLQLGAAALDYQRGGTDRGTALERARREDAQFGVDTQAEKQYQAAGVGYVSPTSMPGNETVSAQGVHTQTHTVGNTVYTVDEHGHVVSTAPVVGTPRQAGVAVGGAAGGLGGAPRLAGAGAGRLAALAPLAGDRVGLYGRRRRR